MRFLQVLKEVNNFFSDWKSCSENKSSSYWILYGDVVDWNLRMNEFFSESQFPNALHLYSHMKMFWIVRIKRSIRLKIYFKDLFHIRDGSSATNIKKYKIIWSKKHGLIKRIVVAQDKHKVNKNISCCYLKMAQYVQALRETYFFLYELRFENCITCNSAGENTYKK